MLKFLKRPSHPVHRLFKRSQVGYSQNDQEEEIETPSKQWYTPSANSSRTCWIRLPYLGKVSNQLSQELRRCDCRVSFYPHTTVNQLSTLKDKIPPAKRSGICRLTCGECPSLYIGQTGRKFSTRLSDHRTAFNKNKPNDSVMAKHCLETAAIILPKSPPTSSAHASKADSWTRQKKFKQFILSKLAEKICSMT